MIYFDNSATTNFKPLSVKFSILNNLKSKNIANPGRSGHDLSIKLGNKIFKARETFAKVFNTTFNNVVFTSGCTEAINLAIFGTVKKNGHIITTINEHNAVLRSLKKLEDDFNIEVSYVKPKGYVITSQDIEKHIKNNTYMIITNHTSNVTGATCDIENIGLLAKKHKLLYLVDAAQSAGHKLIDMKKFNINLLALAGHKGLHGITGVGALLLNNCKLTSTLRYGGTGTYSDKKTQPLTLPEDFEAGTLNYINILAFEKGLIYTMKNFKKINKKLDFLTKYLILSLKKLDKITIFSPENNVSGVVSFNLSNYPSSFISSYLNREFNICIRSGLHCSPLIHKHLGTLESGTCRISLDFKNTKRQIDKLIFALENFC
ncbi:MAG: aminotransferase class V-fold PLP-dependent enzyme [Clostridia bacterium]|nr:aminotransferase class V-fold PLP-dependent enzyme [Clostridia bacterium]